MEIHSFCSKYLDPLRLVVLVMFAAHTSIGFHWCSRPRDLFFFPCRSWHCITLGGREEISWLIPFLNTRFFCFPFSCFHVCKFLLLLEIFANSVSGEAFVLAHYFPLLLLLCSFPFILLYCFYSLSPLQSHLAHPLLSFL